MPESKMILTNHPLYPILSRVAIEHTRSVHKHGDWSDYTPEQMTDKLIGELGELVMALENNQIIGPHGALYEAVHVANCACKMVLELARRMSDRLPEFIETRISEYKPPTRKGTPKGDPIGFTKEKYAASLWDLTDFGAREVCRRAQCNYKSLLNWRTREDFKTKVAEHTKEFHSWLKKQELPNLPPLPRTYLQANAPDGHGGTL